MNTYILTVNHDNGKQKIKVRAMTKEAARLLLCMAEGCPDSAICHVREVKTKKPTV